MADAKILPVYTKFLFASCAGVSATLVSYPLDLLKTRMQVLGQIQGKAIPITTVDLARQILKSDGVLGLYVGLSASCLRQATYTGVRLGAFQTLVDYFSVNGKPPNLLVKCLCGCASGALGGIAGLPADVVLTRMAADGTVPPEKRRNYTGVFSAMLRIGREEGVATLFRGFSPVVVRAAIVNISQLVSYAQSKELLLKYGIMQDNAMCHVTCSVFSAFVATTCVLPPDIAKTRIQNMRVVNGKPEYTGMLDVWKKVVAREGFLSLWKGFTPLFIRNGPQFIVTFVVYENLSRLYRTYIL